MGSVGSVVVGSMAAHTVTGQLRYQLHEDFT